MTQRLKKSKNFRRNCKFWKYWAVQIMKPQMCVHYQMILVTKRCCKYFKMGIPEAVYHESIDNITGVLYVKIYRALK